MNIPPSGTLCYGDCLDWMQRWDDATVDLIYLDPPFNSKADYNVLYAPGAAGGAQTRAFSDTWTWDAAAGERLERFRSAVARPAHKAVVGLAGILGESGMLAYLTYMAERLEHCRRLLRQTGSLYLHCDPTASHHLRTLLDAVFGSDAFLNEVIWSYRRWPTKTPRYQRMHDTLLFYAANSLGKQTFNTEFEPASEGFLRRFKGRANVLDRGATKKRAADHDTPGLPMRDVWSLSIIAPASKERLGYPTQKPLALLERIIQASSKEGDVVLDPFCGCGTTIEAARKLGRQWIGIDISPFAIELVKDKRLRDPTIKTLGIPADLAGARKLAAENPYAFESWAVTRLPGFAPNTHQVGDGGVDGRATLAVAPDGIDSRLALVQVKGGKPSASHFRDFLHVMNRESAAVGCFVTLDSPPARWKADAKGAGSVHTGGQAYDRVHLWSIAEYFDDRWPVLPVMTDPYTGRPINQAELF